MDLSSYIVIALCIIIALITTILCIYYRKRKESNQTDILMTGQESKDKAYDNHVIGAVVNFPQSSNNGNQSQTNNRDTATQLNNGKSNLDVTNISVSSETVLNNPQYQNRVSIHNNIDYGEGKYLDSHAINFQSQKSYHFSEFPRQATIDDVKNRSVSINPEIMNASFEMKMI